MSNRHASEAEIAAAAADDIDDQMFDDAPPPDVSPAVAAEVLAALRRSEVPDPASGQLWRLAADNSGPVVLVWVRKLRSPEAAAVVPVSFDAAMADEYSLIVPGGDNPLEIDVVLHTTAETTVARRSFLNSFGMLDVAADVDAVRLARRRGEPVTDLPVGPPIASMSDERVDFRQQLSAALTALAVAAFEPDSSDEDADHDLPSAFDDEVLLGELLTDPGTHLLVEHLLTRLRVMHPEVRLLPAARVTTFSGVRMIGDLVDLDEVIRIAGFVSPLDQAFVASLAHEVFSLDPSVQAMCFAPLNVDADAMLINRRTHRESFTSVGMHVPESELWTGPVLDVLFKYFDRFVDPFATFQIPSLDVLTLDTRALAREVGAQAVRNQAARATGFRVAGKPDGYRRVELYEAAVIEVVRQALDRDVDHVDILAVLEGEP